MTTPDRPRAALARISPVRFNWEHKADLGQSSTLGVGGGASRFAYISDDDSLVRAWGSLGDSDRRSMTPLGGLSNVVISDDGLAFPVLALTAGSVSFQGETVTAEGGLAWDALVAACVDHGLSGNELMSGIPGTVAGAPVQNIGAYGQALSDTLVDLEAFNKVTGEVVRLDADDCGFAYRTSRFKTEGSWVVLRVRLALSSSKSIRPVTYPELAKELDQHGTDAHQDLRARRQSVLTVRHRKGMLTGPQMPNTAGSFFQSPFIGRDQAAEVARRVIGPDVETFEKFLASYGNTPGASKVKVPAAQVLLASGFRNGDRWGRVGLSKRHIVAVENLGGASSHDISGVAAYIGQRTSIELGINIEPEPIFLGQFPSDTEALVASVGPLYQQAGSHTPGWVSTHCSTYIDTAANTASADQASSSSD